MRMLRFVRHGTFDKGCWRRSETKPYLDSMATLWVFRYDAFCWLYYTDDHHIVYFLQCAKHAVGHQYIRHHCSSRICLSQFFLSYSNAGIQYLGILPSLLSFRNRDNYLFAIRKSFALCTLLLADLPISCDANYQKGELICSIKY